MPNWCYNKVTFSHEDPKEITRLINAAKVGKLFNEFYPMPPELLEEAEQGAVQAGVRARDAAAPVTGRAGHAGSAHASPTARGAPSGPK